MYIYTFAFDLQFVCTVLCTVHVRYTQFNDDKVLHQQYTIRTKKNEDFPCFMVYQYQSKYYF